MVTHNTDESSSDSEGPPSMLELTSTTVHWQSLSPPNFNDSEITLEEEGTNPPL